MHNLEKNNIEHVDRFQRAAFYISALYGFAIDHEGLLMMNSHQEGCECINFAPQSVKLCHSAIWGCQDRPYSSDGEYLQTSALVWIHEQQNTAMEPQSTVRV